ncbi:essential MCU regulator, mitochondrial-like [Teleopsis dalmanni]|uniref:essential MCU regulator, mitochondrial-like n=1 Tax=Teleopsis dalmanni TaxID=139649 RepID=UPI0018CCE193|nr:essential MCU regulator, mitochondrial-like [Teleopsis dalmanni]XP_037949590.1 essential MCU regulator, mitochondrial-like [Teleopsis dalmanni]XP_037949591.1 essential MCU regulator, mitochondrial-like [Teleopsis dalmanni]XP_037949592.1 essential MCU regulator, mitochondrial-like [Teleopsis dalmanni]XP_037949593.1 essential MCU regulator, mitochondrial-like [Teleopsis dalmanni]
MATSRLLILSRQLPALINFNKFCRHATYFRSGALKPKPEQMSFGIVGVVCAVVPGLFIGAAISKSIANFLEENELFVPSDDDDDDMD